MCPQSLGIGVLEEEEEEMECSGLPAECWNRRRRVPDYLSIGLPVSRAECKMMMKSVPDSQRSVGTGEGGVFRAPSLSTA